MEGQSMGGHTEDVPVAGIAAAATPRRHGAKALRVRGLSRRAGAVTLRLLERGLPQARWADRLVFQLRFQRELGRLPLAADHPRATYNDYLLDRLLREDWDPLERACIDKEHAKLFAAGLCPGLEAAATRAVFHLAVPGAAHALARDLAARAGRAEVAKPTHGSGSLLFLRHRPGPAEIADFVAIAERDFGRLARESQYRGLARKVIIEDDLSQADETPADYKFFCSRGEILFCEVVTGRFTSYRRHVVTADFARSIATAEAGSNSLPSRPANLDDMLQVARRLSEPFRFVRVDLYSVGGKVHFGELTFVPHAATGALVSESFGRWVLSRIRLSGGRMVEPGGIEPPTS